MDGFVDPDPIMASRGGQRRERNDPQIFDPCPGCGGEVGLWLRVKLCIRCLKDTTMQMSAGMGN